LGVGEGFGVGVGSGVGSGVGDGVGMGVGSGVGSGVGVTVGVGSCEGKEIRTGVRTGVSIRASALSVVAGRDSSTTDLVSPSCKRSWDGNTALPKRNKATATGTHTFPGSFTFARNSGHTSKAAIKRQADAMLNPYTTTPLTKNKDRIHPMMAANFFICNLHTSRPSTKLGRLLCWFYALRLSGVCQLWKGKQRVPSRINYVNQTILHIL